MPANEPTSLPPLITRDFMLLVAAHFLQALGFSSMLLLPLYVDWLGADRAEIGLIMASAAIGGLVCRPLVGWGLDAWGRKKTLVVGTLLLVAGMGPLIYVSRVLVGVGTGTLFTGYFTFAADLIPDARRTEGLALFGVSGLVPLLINPFVGELNLRPADLPLVYPVLAGLVFVSLLFLWPIAEAKRDGAAQQIQLGAVVRALKARSLWSVWLATAVFASLVAVFMSFVTVTAEQRGLERPAAVWLTYALAAVCVRLFAGRLPDRVGPANLVAPALALYAFAGVAVSHALTVEQFL
ncbi:MFS transporter, partial [Planctomycetota bacterium]|nr:MFS transporter [Planctomycetota bacterium]